MNVQSMIISSCLRRALLFSALMISPLQIFAESNSSDLSGIFFGYEKTLESYVQAISEDDWPTAVSKAFQLQQQSEHLHQLGIDRQNEAWEYYSSNLLNHCIELRHVSLAHNRMEAIYLVATLLSHIVQVQSSNPLWLRDHVGQQIQVIEAAMATRNISQVRNAAEIIHTAANKILLSVTSSPETYKHSYWVGNIMRMNELGDEILGEVNQDKWRNIPAKLAHIQHIYGKWAESFQESL